MNPSPHVSITKRATISIYNSVSPRDLIRELQALPEEWQNGKMHFEVHNDQRDGQSVKIVIDAK